MDQQKFAEERKLEILAALDQKRKLTVNELVEQFGVSGATIRSDLRSLEQQGLLLRTHGGAIPKTKATFELAAKDREVQNHELKRRIARSALELVEDGDTIVLDTGSTTLELAKLLEVRRELTVVTNDLTIASTLDRGSSATVLLVGGRLRKSFLCTVGTIGGGMLDGITVDKAFIGANGFSLEMGASTPDLQQAEMKRMLIKIASRVILLADSTKIGRNSFVQFAPPSEIDCVVTDSLGAEQQSALEEEEIDVRIAE